LNLFVGVYICTDIDAYLSYNFNICHLATTSLNTLFYLLTTMLIVAMRQKYDTEFEEQVRSTSQFTLHRSTTLFHIVSRSFTLFHVVSVTCAHI